MASGLASAPRAKRTQPVGQSQVVLKPYAGEEHLPFLWSGTGSQAALLLHGFPGTPAEMRPAGEMLLAHGVSAQGILLPGFGPEIGDLAKVDLEKWLSFVRDQLGTLRKSHDRIILVGNSMGAALATIVAAECPIAGLILFSPFWRIEQRWLDGVFPIARHLFPRLYPFKNSDFGTVETRTELRRVLGDVDLDNDTIQEQIRQLPLPTSVLAQLRRAGRLGHRLASRVKAPVLILQGRDDPVVRPHITQALAQQYPRLAGYIELPGNHDLVTAQNESWPLVRRACAAFLMGLVSEHPPSPHPAR